MMCVERREIRRGAVDAVWMQALGPLPHSPRHPVHSMQMCGDVFVSARRVCSSVLFCCVHVGPRQMEIV